jgi:hypothetical protein
MADQEQIPPKPETREDADEQGGVFGNLPGRRPAVRSPRRGDAGDDAAAAAKAAGRQSRPAARPKPSVPRSPGGRSTRPPGHSPAAEPETPPPAGGVEDLAWAGIAVAAEAATLGVRLLSRAVEAVRKPADRR